MKYLGTFWTDSNIEVYEIEGKKVALNGWNGEVFTDCFIVSEYLRGVFYFYIPDSECEVIPVYNDNKEVIDYKFY